MARLEILTFPNPILRKVSTAVETVTDEMRAFVQDMIETMYESRGIGLAAPQVGRNIRLIVLDTRPKENGRYQIEDMTELERKAYHNGPLVLFNPEVKKKQGKQTYEEGCLSVPTFYETVERADVIELHALNEQGEKIVIEADGLLSVCLQHEIDHLDGKLFIDRLSMIKSTRIKDKIRKHGYPKPVEEKPTEKS